MCASIVIQSKMCAVLAIQVHTEQELVKGTVLSNHLAVFTSQLSVQIVKIIVTSVYEEKMIE